MGGIIKDTTFAKTHKMLDELFTFPIVMIDGDNEERKMRNKPDLGIQTDEPEEEYDMVFGEAEYPYFDFIGIEDRWLPSAQSLDKALTGKFEACMVRFLHVGQLLVPWSKRKFKSELVKFAEAYEVAHPKTQEKKPELRIMALSAEQFKKQMEDGSTKPE